MASSDLYLYRKDRRWQKVSKVQEVSLTGGQTAYASVTGVASTNVVTITGASLANGMLVNFTSLSGGSGLSAGVGYYVIDASGATCKLALTQGGSAIDFTTDITSGSVIVSIDEMRVWSSEFRDQFSNTTTLWPELGTIPGTPITAPGSFVGAAAVIPTVFTGGGSNGLLGTGAGGLAVEGTTDLLTSVSDEIAHAPLRQTLLKRTHWRFDIADFGPLYATWADGDIIATNPPNSIIDT